MPLRDPYYHPPVRRRRLPIHRMSPDALTLSEYVANAPAQDPWTGLGSFVLDLSEMGWPALLLGAEVALELAMPGLDPTGPHRQFIWPEQLWGQRSPFAAQYGTPYAQRTLQAVRAALADPDWRTRPLHVSRGRTEPSQPAYLPQEPGVQQYENFYRCPSCGATWSDIWTATSDDECPACGATSIQPLFSIEHFEAGEPTDVDVDLARARVNTIARAVATLLELYRETDGPPRTRVLAAARLQTAVDGLSRLGWVFDNFGDPIDFVQVPGGTRGWMIQRWKNEVERRLPIARGKLVGNRSYEEIQRRLQPRPETWGETTWPPSSEPAPPGVFIGPVEFSYLPREDYLPAAVFTLRLLRDLDQVASESRRWPPFASQVLEVLEDLLRLPRSRRRPGVQQLLTDVRSVPDDPETDKLRNAIAQLLTNELDPEASDRFEPFTEMGSWGTQGLPTNLVDAFVEVWEQTLRTRLPEAPPPPAAAVNIFEGVPGLNAAHRGITDFYDRHEEALRQAIEMGDEAHWTTGWFASKHAIASGRVTHQPGGQLLVEVNVTNDFDEEGLGYVEDVNISGFSTDMAFEQIAASLEAAHQAALDTQNEYATVAMYRVGRPTDASPEASARWEQTYLVDLSDWGLPDPPGDHYHRWGWADVEEDDDLNELIPPQVREQLEGGMHSLEERVEAGGWIAERV